MWIDPPATSPDPRRVIGVQYFLYFGVLGIYLPYFNLYCHHIGLSGFEIGTLSAVRSITLVVFPIVWGILADRFQARRLIFMLCNGAGTVLWTLYFFSTDFRFMFVVTACYGVFYAPLISFLETFTMETLGHARESYGRIRVWGSISFIAMVTVLGPLIDRFSVDIILPAILCGSILMAYFSRRIPLLQTLPRQPLLPHAGAFFNRKVMVFLLCAFLMLVSHGTYYGFFSIHLERLGFGKAFIGVAWALASAAEILVMLRSRNLFHRFSLETVLAFSFFIAAGRWWALAWVASPLGILLTQLLHAATYGMFHMASIIYIDRLSPEKAKTLGQAANNALTYGLGLMTGFFISGWLYESVGAESLFAISGAIALVGGVVFRIAFSPRS